MNFQNKFPVVDEEAGLDLENEMANAQAASRLATEAPPEEAAPVDTRLQDAHLAGNKQQLYSDLLRSFQTAIQASAPQSGFKADFSQADSMSKRSGDQAAHVKELMAQEAGLRKEAMEKEKFGMEKEKFGMEQDDHEMKRTMHAKNVEKLDMDLKKSNIDIMNEEANNDPGSPSSQMAQQITISQLEQQYNRPLTDQEKAAVQSRNATTLTKQNPQLQQLVAGVLQKRQHDETLTAQATNQEKSLASAEKIAAAHDAKDLEKQKLTNEQTDKKEKKKEDLVVNKENRKMRRELDAAENSLITKIELLKNAKAKAKAYNDKSITGGTGPIANAFGLKKVDNDVQELDNLLNSLALGNLTTQFQGMSKAIDSEGERAMFQSTQATSNMDGPVLDKTLQRYLDGAESLLAKTKAAKGKFDKSGKFVDDDPEDETVVGTAPPNGQEYAEQNGKQYKWNRQAGKYQLIGTINAQQQSE